MFDLGKVSVSHSAALAIEESSQQPEEFIRRHQSGDWGDVPDETREKNRIALERNEALESVYHTTKGDKILVMTDADRGATRVSMPLEV